MLTLMGRSGKGFLVQIQCPSKSYWTLDNTASQRKQFTSYYTIIQIILLGLIFIDCK